MTVNDDGQMLRNGKCKRTVEEQQAANDQKRAALGDISNKALQRCEQVTTSPRRARLCRARRPLRSVDGVAVLTACEVHTSR